LGTHGLRGETSERVPVYYSQCSKTAEEKNILKLLMSKHGEPDHSMPQQQTQSEQIPNRK
jgi:hypothetical protein